MDLPFYCSVLVTHKEKGWKLHVYMIPSCLLSHTAKSPGFQWSFLNLSQGPAAPTCPQTGSPYPHISGISLRSLHSSATVEVGNKRKLMYIPHDTSSRTWSYLSCIPAFFNHLAKKTRYSIFSGESWLYLLCRLFAPSWHEKPKTIKGS